MKLFRFLANSLQLWREKELREIVLNHPDTLPQALDKHYSAGDQEKIQELKNKIDELKEKLPEKPHPKKEYWNNKHQKAEITYQRPIWNGDEFENHDIDIRLFITPNTYEVQREAERFSVDNPMKINKDVIDLYEQAQLFYDYEYDSKDLGISEYWKFPWETLHQERGDCEDWANVIVSYLIAGGVPRWRVRNVCGMVNSGRGGHSTVYVLDDSLETWRHLNSTSTVYHDSLLDYPEYGDSDDDIGIDPDRTWFSFNDRYAWSEMATGQIELNGVDIQ